MGYGLWAMALWAMIRASCGVLCGGGAGMVEHGVRGVLYSYVFIWCGALLLFFKLSTEESTIDLPFPLNAAYTCIVYTARRTAMKSRASLLTSSWSCCHRLIRPGIIKTSISLSVTRPRKASSLAPVQPPVSTALPSDAFQLLSTQDKAGASENELYEQQVRDVKDWWQSSRYEGIKRPYSPGDVVSKRGSLQQTYPSSIMARKLFNLLNERATTGQPVHTSKRVISHISYGVVYSLACSGGH